MKLTVFTPTYNRASKLNRVYQSLLKQNCFDFEWLIVDDGSVDSTEETVRGFQNEVSPFDIRYVKQENGGKHRAYNEALKLALGDFFFCLDSDDWLEENVVKKVLSACQKLKNGRFIVAYKKDENGKLLSNCFPEIENCTLWELSEKYHCYGEYSLIFPTELAKRFPFPTFEGEKFITESVVYDQIGTVADITILPEVITICEYQADGLTNNLTSVMKQNPSGFCLYFMQRIDLVSSHKERIINAGKYQCFCIFAGKNKSRYFGKYKILVGLTKPLGMLFRIYYVRKRGF